MLVPALIALGVGVYAYNEHAARITAEELLRALQHKRATLRQSQTNGPTAIPVATPATAAPMPTVPDGPETPADGPLRAPGLQRPVADFAVMMDSPEMQQLMSLRSRGALDSRYAALFKSLGLPADQLQKFQQLLLDKQSTMRDVLSAMRSQGLAPNRENAGQMRTLVDNANAEIDSQIRTTLGDAAYAQYQDYERTQPQRATVDRVQQRLSYSGEPLTAQQATQLVGILAQNAPAQTQTSAGALRRTITGVAGAAPLTTQALDQARAVLSPGQMTALQELQHEQEAQAQLVRRSRDNFTGPRPPGQ